VDADGLQGQGRWCEEAEAKGFYLIL
jgi:hypothetical protein